MDHPMVREIEATGYPNSYLHREHYGMDGLGNEVFVGDEILVLNEEFFLVETLMSETIDALEAAGAERKNAEKKNP